MQVKQPGVKPEQCLFQRGDGETCWQTIKVAKGRKVNEQGGIPYETLTLKLEYSYGVSDEALRSATEFVQRFSE